MFVIFVGYCWLLWWYCGLGCINSLTFRVLVCVWVLLLEFGLCCLTHAGLVCCLVVALP